MKSGDLRIFSDFTIGGTGNFYLAGTPIILIEPTPRPYTEKLWKVLVNGREDTVDEYTIRNRTHESR